MRIPVVALATALALSGAAHSAEGAPDPGRVGRAVPQPPSPKASATGPGHVPTHVPGPGSAGTPNAPALVGGTPGVNIGGTPTSGPPGTGGAAGGPALGGQ